MRSKNTIGTLLSIRYRRSNRYESEDLPSWQIKKSRRRMETKRIPCKPMLNRSPNSTFSSRLRKWEKRMKKIKEIRKNLAKHAPSSILGSFWPLILYQISRFFYHVIDEGWPAGATELQFYISFFRHNYLVFIMGDFGPKFQPNQAEIQNSISKTPTGHPLPITYAKKNHTV